MYRYYDIHTHSSSAPDDTLAIQSLYKDLARAATGIPCTIGLHPWHLDDHEKQFTEVVTYATLPNVLAIGECGLDRLSPSGMQLQETVFAQHIALACELGKPLIIHCVRAFDELIAALDKHKVQMPVIIHGFNKKGIAERLLQKGYFLSFGAALLDSRTPAAEVFQQIPPDRYFLETDDAPQPISDIYRCAAGIKATTAEDIILQVQKNFKNVFKR